MSDILLFDHALQPSSSDGKAHQQHNDEQHTSGSTGHVSHREITAVFRRLIKPRGAMVRTIAPQFGVYARTYLRTLEQTVHVPQGLS